MSVYKTEKQNATLTCLSTTRLSFASTFFSPFCCHTWNVYFQFLPANSIHIPYMEKRSWVYFCGFCGFSFNRESIPMNYGLINQQYKSTTATAKVLLWIAIFTQNVKVFPHGCFPVYDIASWLQLTWCCDLISIISSHVQVKKSNSSCCDYSSC